MKVIQAKIQAGEIIKVHFTALAQGGVSVGTADGVGIKVFASGVVPSEDALVKVVENKGNFCFAELVEVLNKSPDRVEPSCPCFDECGGCDLQMINIERQRRLKLEFVEGTLKHQIKNIPEFKIYLLSNNIPALFYRRRVTLHCDKQGNVGFFRKKSGTVIPITECQLIVSELNAVLPSVKEFVKKNAGKILGVVLEYHDDKTFILLKVTKKYDWNELVRPLRKIFSVIQVQIEQVVYQENKVENDTFPYGHFCQVNFEANKLLIEYVVKKIKGSSITEFYAGAGNFSFPLAQNKDREIKAIELDSALTEYADFLINKNNISNLKFVTSSTEKYLKHGTVTKSVLLDPPRSGAKALAQFCNPKLQQEIVYVSCNPATLARDLKILLDKGYQLEEVAVLDMFPQTQHVESVAVLKN